MTGNDKPDRKMATIVSSKTAYLVKKSRFPPTNRITPKNSEIGKIGGDSHGNAQAGKGIREGE